MINWEEFGRSQLARTALNLSQLCRREASDLAFHRKAVARKMIGPHSHRGGHWFDPSIAHQKVFTFDLRLSSRLCLTFPCAPGVFRGWRRVQG
jgi:hypothetical protein